MKIPGVGEVKNSWLAVGGAGFLGVLGYAYYKNHKASQANAAALSSANDASQYSDTGGSPDYGTNYGGEYYAGYGGVDPNTDVPYAYENYLDYGQSSSTSTYTTNEEWVTAAISAAQGFGNTYAAAQKAVEDYMAQSPSGLPASEYAEMQSVVAELGPPPTGTFRLIQATPGTTSNPPSGGQPPSGGGGSTPVTDKSIAQSVGKVVQIPYLVKSPNTMAKTAAKFGISTAHLVSNNPGKTASYQGVVNVPMEIKKGMTLASIASAFGDGQEHMAQILSSQGVI